MNRLRLAWKFALPEFCKAITGGMPCLRVRLCAIPAQVGLDHAFHHGADFVIAGMFDFQIAALVDIVVKALKRTKLRERPLRA